MPSKLLPTTSAFSGRGGIILHRREILRLLTAAALSPLSTEVLVAVRQARAETGSTAGLRTLNEHQDATVTTMAEAIIPETDTPGAKVAKVNEFIDLMLTEWFNREEASAFLQGLARVDEESRKRFGAEYIACKPSEQNELMKQLDDASSSFAGAHRAAAQTSDAAPQENFFYTFKRLTLVGYYTSEIGFKKELGKSVIPPSHAGCAPLAGARS